uniref:Uncharacterized protein n=1 Tax=Sphaerodactylus townsendi TaxID=933632 RepID=A0ACB8F674_9SAUR
MLNQKSNKGKKNKRANSSRDEQENGALAAAAAAGAAAGTIGALGMVAAAGGSEPMAATGGDGSAGRAASAMGSASADARNVKAEGKGRGGPGRVGQGTSFSLRDWIPEICHGVFLRHRELLPDARDSSTIKRISSIGEGFLRQRIALPLVEQIHGIHFKKWEWLKVIQVSFLTEQECKHYSPETSSSLQALSLVSDPGET